MLKKVSVWQGHHKWYIAIFELAKALHLWYECNLFFRLSIKDISEIEEKLCKSYVSYKNEAPIGFLKANFKAETSDLDVIGWLLSLWGCCHCQYSIYSNSSAKLSMDLIRNSWVVRGSTSGNRGLRVPIHSLVENVKSGKPC